MTSKRKAALLDGMQSALRPGAPKQGKAGALDLGHGALVSYHPGFILASDTAAIFRKLQPRLISYQADSPKLAYVYSKTEICPTPWTTIVAELKARLEALTGTTFNSCLLNMYEHGSHHLSWHSDNEPVYGQTPTVASISFGEPRDFVLRRNADHGDKWGFRLGSGDVLVMSGTTQQHWQHAVPKRAGIVRPRINLTFRRITDEWLRRQ